MDIDAAELQDWEVLLPDPISTDSGFVHPAENPNVFEEIGSDSEGMVHTNYFSIDSADRYMSAVVGANVSESGSEASDNPSWIDPGSETRYPRKDSGEFWPDSGSDRSDDRKFEGKEELGILQKDQIRGVFDGIEEIGGGNGKNVEEFWSDSGGIEIGGLGIERFEETEELGVEGDGNLHETESNGSENVGGIVEIEPRKAGEVEKRSVVWWKVPFEILKYCVFRASPVWTFSVAAAVMGFVILGRRLYKMKKKTRSLELKVAMDDKKVSQFMGRAARLNEVFSVVKRAPLIRPQLPSAGVIPWPVMALI